MRGQDSFALMQGQARPSHRRSGNPIRQVTRSPWRPQPWSFRPRQQWRRWIHRRRPAGTGRLARLRGVDALVRADYKGDAARAANGMAGRCRRLATRHFWRRCLRHRTVVVDALFGIGLDRPFQEVRRP